MKEQMKGSDSAYSLPGLSLRVNFAWTSLASVINAAFQWAKMMALTKLVTPELVGQWSLALAITGPIFLFANLGLRDVQVTETRGDYSFNDFFGLRFTTTILALLITIGIIFWSGYDWYVSALIFIIGIRRVSDSITDLWYALFQAHERLDRIAISSVIKTIPGVTMYILILFLTGNLILTIITTLTFTFIIFLFYDVPNGKIILSSNKNKLEFNNSTVQVNMKPRWQKEKMKELFLLAWPLGLVMLLVSLNPNIPRYAIENYLGARELGIFAALATFMQVGGMVIGPLSASALPRFTQYYASGKKQAFRTLMLKIIIMAVLTGLAGVAVAAIAGRQIVAMMYRPEYAERNEVLILLMLATCFSYVAAVLGNCMTSMRYFKIQMPLFAGVVLSSFLASYILIPKYGLNGAPVALIISYIAQSLFSWIVVEYGLRNIKEN